MYVYDIFTFNVKSKLQGEWDLIHVKTFFDDFKFALMQRHSRTQGSLVIEAEGKDRAEITKIMQSKQEKITNFFHMVLGMDVELLRTTTKTFDTKEDAYVEFDDLCGKINKESFRKHLNKPLSENEGLLMEAMNEYEQQNWFDAFPKLVNWLEENHTVQTEFCSLRNCCSHKRPKDRAKVEKRYPGEFEFDGEGILKRKSSINIRSFQKYLPGLATSAREAYVKMINQS